MSDDAKKTIDEFTRAVNMTPTELSRWLESEASQSVGQKEDGEESIGHASGRRIIDLLQNKQDDYTDDDLRHMS